MREILHWLDCVTPDVETEVVLDVALDVDQEWNLVLYNDEHNTFDHVIDSLVSVCSHSSEQAEQCAMIVHTKGKCAVKSGSLKEVEKQCARLLTFDLTAEVEP
jgi:ATP-dependent Clp protease adaptor protein ClpS